MTVLASALLRARAFTLAGVLLVALAGRARAECKPAVVIEGDAELAGALIGQLAAGGIATSPTAGCPAVQVWLEQRGEHVHLRVIDAYARSGERDVQDVATAAAIVASWTLQEVEARALPPADAAVHRVVRDGVAIALVSALAGDRRTWVGAGISTCFRFGPVCSGPGLRVERALGATGNGDRALSVRTTLDLPRRLGGFVVSPGATAGYHWLHVTTRQRDAMNQEMDVETTDRQLRAGAHVAVTHAWGDYLSLSADVGGELAFGRSQPQVEPRAALWLAIGVRIEVP